MKTDAALDAFDLLQRRKHRGPEGRLASTALSALREYLVEYSGTEDTERLTPRDLYEFLLEYYPDQEEPDPEVALSLMETVAAFARWLLERGERALTEFVASEDRLREALPRALEALALLKAHSRRDDLTTSIDVATGDDEEDAGEIGTMTAGAQRVARLDEIDYAAGEEDHFILRSVAPGALSLSSPQRETLGDAPLTPVRVPAEASGLLRVGDIIHAEIAPGPDGWELLEVFGIRPGGFA
jgi:hypothetical protein